MKALITWLGAAMGDGENPSSMRLIAVLCVPALLLVPLFVWAGLSIRARALLEFPATVTGFIGAALTPTLTFLHLNKREETKTQNAALPGGAA